MKPLNTPAPLRLPLALGKSGSRSPAPFRLSWIMIGLTIIVFGGAIVTVSLHLRGQIRQQMMSRDAEILYAVALTQQYELTEQEPLLNSFDDPATQLEIVLKTSRLRVVIAARLFDRSGTLLERFPATVSDATLPAAVLAELEQLRPVSRFHPTAKVDEVVLSIPDPEGEPFPVLEVNIPLHRHEEKDLLGTAQFLITGESIAHQFAALDRHLVRQSSVIFLVGSALITFGLHQAFRRLQRSNRLLSQRTDELLRANKEIVLASKTSAIGAVAAHLIHGLKNPLFGLKNLTAQYAHESDGSLDPSWQTAAATAEQMQSIVNEVVRVLQDEQTFVDCHISLSDLVEVIESRLDGAAAELGLRFSAQCKADIQISHRAANLVLLILQNLIQNAFQATPKGKAVHLTVSENSAGAVCEVRDEGPGIPDHLHASLFAPCRSNKPQSTGLGLAISKQLANHLGAQLSLKENSSQGCTFALTLPGNLLLQNTTNCTDPRPTRVETPVQIQDGKSRRTRWGLRQAAVRFLEAIGSLTAALLGFSFAEFNEAAAADLPIVWRWSNPRPHGNNIVAMAHRNGWVVQVGERGQIYASRTLDQWTPRESHTTQALRSVTFFGEKVVITGENGTILVAASIEPIHLFQSIDLKTADWLEGVASSVDLLVAVGDNGAVYTSPDALAWTRRPQPFSTWLRGVTYGNGLFVTVGERGFIASSTDGNDWQVRNSGVSDHLNRVAWINNRFVAAGEAGRLLNSTDGIAWQPIGPITTNKLATVTSSPSTLLAAGANEAHLLENGIWSDQIRSPNSFPAPNWTYLSSLWDGTLFLLAGRTGRIVEGFKTNAASPTAWIERHDSIRHWLWDLFRTPEFYIAVGDRATVMTSEDGIRWELELVPASLTNAVFLGVGGSTNLLIAVGNKGRLMTSSNGVVWEAIPVPSEQDLQGVTSGHGQYVVTGGNGTILTSTNGTNWRAQNSSTSAFLSSVVSGPNGFVACGSSGAILQSADGRTWTRRSSGTTNWIYRVRQLPGTLVAVGQNGTLLTSVDGSSWMTRGSGTARWLNDVTQVGGRFIAVGTQGTVLESRDLIQWTSIGTATEKSLFSAASHEGQIVVAGVEGAILRSQVVPDPTPVSIQSYSRRTGQNLFLFLGKPDQRFTLDRSLNLSRWTASTPLEFIDGTSTLLYLENSDSILVKEFFRATNRRNEFFTETRSIVESKHTNRSTAYGPSSPYLEGVPRISRNHQAAQRQQRNVPKNVRRIPRDRRSDLSHRRGDRFCD